MGTPFKLGDIHKPPKYLKIPPVSGKEAFNQTVSLSFEKLSYL
jgi:hypothetical protein